jgi:branched-chain amino acid transport system ATP-binding protein
MLLEINDLVLRYGRIDALHGISLHVDDGEVVALIGANGAGKTTTMRAISGLRPVANGSIHFDGDDITRLRADLRVVRGICQSPEGRGVFPGMTVLENLDMGAYTRRDAAGIAADLDRVFTLFPRLAERRRQAGGTLSGGEQQMLAIGRALMGEPRLLLLDEPSLGLAPKLVAQIFESIVAIAKTGITILLVEQNTRLALETSEHAHVLVTGEIALSGRSAALKEDPRIRAAYFGEDVQA